MKVSFKGVTVQESVLFWDYKAEANTAEYIFRPTDDQAEIVKSLAPISGIRIEEKRACIDNVKHFVTDHPFLQPRHSTSLTTEEPNKSPGTDKPSSSFFKRRMKPWPSARLSDKELRSLKNTSGSLSQEEDSRHSVHLIPITPQTSPSLNPLEFPDTLASGQLFQPYGKLDLDTIIPEKTAPEDWRKTVVYRKALNDANKEHIQKSEIQLLKDAQDITKEVYQIAGPTLFDLKGQVISILESCLAILENALKEIDHVKYPFPNSIYPFFRSLIVQAMVNTEDNFKSYESVTSARDEKYIKQQIAKLKLVRPRLLSFHYFEDPDLTKITDDFQLQAYLDQLKSKLSLRQRLELRVLLAGLEQIILESIRYEWQFKKEIPRLEGEFKKHSKTISIYLSESEKERQATVMHSVYALIKAAISPQEAHKKPHTDLDGFTFSLMGKLITYIHEHYFCKTPFVGDVTLKGTWKDESKEPRDVYIRPDFAELLMNSLSALVTPVLYHPGRKYAFPAPEQQREFETLILNHLTQQIDELISSATAKSVPSSSSRADTQKERTESDEREAKEAATFTL